LDMKLAESESVVSGRKRRGERVAISMEEG
jgi:hypothetical protein